MREREDKIRQAFEKIKQDLAFFYQELFALRKEIKEIKQFLGLDTSQTGSRHINQISTHKLQNLKEISPISEISTGNEGVSTDRQTDRHMPFDTFLSQKFKDSPTETLSDVVQTLKKDFIDKFKKLTNKEFLIFSVLYTLEEEKEKVSYRDIAEKIKITESSVRDHVKSIIKKGVPIIKEKENNKTIILRISPDLKNISSLEALSKIRS